MITLQRRPPWLLLALLCLSVGQILFAVASPIPRSVQTLLGIGLLALGGALAIRGSGGDESYPAVQPSRTIQTVGIIGLFLLAAALRALWLDTIPFRVDGDAAAFATGAAAFLQPDRPPLIGTGWQGHTNLYFFLVSLALRLFGPTILGIRAFGALGGMLGVLAIYALGTALWDRQTGLLAAFVAALLPFDLVFSRVGTEVIHLTWLVPLTILCLWRGWQRNSWVWLIVGGLIAGLSQYVYPGARLIPILAVAQIGLLTRFPPDGVRTTWRTIQRGIRAFGWALVGFTLIYGPMIRYYLDDPESYMARVKLVSIFSSGWLARQLAAYPWWQVAIDQLSRAYLPFVYPVNGARLWYVWPQYLGPFDAALLILGLISVYRGRRTARWLRFFLLIYLVGGIFLAGVLTIDTPMPSRYMIFIPAVALLIGRALAELIRSAALRMGGSCRLALVALAIYGGFNLNAYLRHDTDAIWRYDLTGQVATYAARYLRALPDQRYTILFLKAPLLYYNAGPALPFLTGKPGIDVADELSCAALNDYVLASQTIVIAPPARIAELRRMQAAIQPSQLAVYKNPRGQEVVGLLRLPQVATSRAFYCTPLDGGTPAR